MVFVILNIFFLKKRRYHRKFVVELLNDYSNELKYTEEHILAENKNYHAWVINIYYYI